MERQPEASIKASLSPEEQAKIFKPSPAEKPPRQVEVVDKGPRVGDVVLVKRSSDRIEEAPVGVNAKGEKVILVTMEDGRPGARPLRAEAVSVEAQHQLAEARQQAEAEAARAAAYDAIDTANEALIPYGDGVLITDTDGSNPDAMKFYSKSPAQLTQPPATSIPAASPNAPIPKHEPFVDDNPARRITTIDPQGVRPSDQR